MSTQTTSDSDVKSDTNLIDAILSEAEQHGLSFVEDEWTETSDGEEIFNPFVDRENAMMWLREKLLEVAKK